MGNVLLWITLAHEYIDIFVNIDTHRTWGTFKKSWICCDFDKTWSACQFDDGSC